MSLRKFLHRWLPSPETLFASRALGWAKPWLGHPRLWVLHRRGVALGVAIGLLTGLVPGPVQIIFAALIAVPLRANIPAAALATLYTNPVTFVPLYLLAWKIGAVLTGNHAAIEVPALPEFSWLALPTWISALLSWLVSLGPTLLLGLAVMGLSFAVLGYGLVMLGWRVAVGCAWKKRRLSPRPSLQ